MSNYQEAVGTPQPLFYAKKSKKCQKYVDYRKKFKYSVSDGSILAYYNGADYTFTWAWASLAGDVVDLLPFVTGVGEATKAVGVTVKAAKRGDDAVDAARKLYNGADKASKFRKSTGTYEIIYEIGKNYVGKGGFARSIKSAANHAKTNKLNGYQGDAVLSITWIPAESKEKAFMNEYLMQLSKGKNNSNTYNLI